MPPSNQIFKFDIETNTTALPTVFPALSTPGETGIPFNLQIVEKFAPGTPFGSQVIGSTVVGMDVINDDVAVDIANLITSYFADHAILTSATDSEGTNRNVRSMKLIVNVDPTA